MMTHLKQDIKKKGIVRNFGVGLMFCNLHGSMLSEAASLYVFKICYVDYQTIIEVSLEY